MNKLLQKDISGSPVWQQIGKQGSLTEQYYVFANNAKQQITKPQILKNQPQSMVWDSAYSGANFALRKPNEITEFTNGFFNPGPPNMIFWEGVGAGSKQIFDYLYEKATE